MSTVAIDAHPAAAKPQLRVPPMRRPRRMQTNSAMQVPAEASMDTTQYCSDSRMVQSGQTSTQE